MEEKKRMKPNLQDQEEQQSPEEMKELVVKAEGDDRIGIEGPSHLILIS